MLNCVIFVLYLLLVYTMFMLQLPNSTNYTNEMFSTFILPRVRSFLRKTMVGRSMKHNGLMLDGHLMVFMHLKYFYSVKRETIEYR
jgi:hypothetical protein